MNDFCEKLEIQLIDSLRVFIDTHKWKKEEKQIDYHILVAQKFNDRYGRTMVNRLNIIESEVQNLPKNKKIPLREIFLPIIKRIFEKFPHLPRAHVENSAPLYRMSKY